MTYDSVFKPGLFTGQTILITGGGSGIGRSIAINFAAQGATVHILDLKVDGSTAAEIVAAGGHAKEYACDVSNQQQVTEVIAGIAAENSIDILVNNAGVAMVGALEQTSEADFDRIFDINVKGIYNCMYACIKHMVARRCGVILNMCSIAGSLGIKDRFAYCMSKGAVRTMTFSVARDYIDKGVRCNCISPARVHTPFVDKYLAENYPGHEPEMFDKLAKTQPIGRMGKPEEVADLALYLCSDEAAFVTGTDYPIDGGFIRLNS